MGDLEDQLRARAYRQAATMYARWWRHRPREVPLEAFAVFAEMEIEDDWTALACALVDIGCNLGKIPPGRVPAYLDWVIQEAILNEGTADDG